MRTMRGGNLTRTLWLALALTACGGDDDDETRKPDGGQGADGDELDAGHGDHDAGGDDGATGDGSERDGGHDGAEPDAGNEPDSSTPPPSIAACLDAAVARDSLTERLEFKAGSTLVGIVRYVDPDGFGTSGTTIWLPERVAYARGGASACITDAAKLSYTVSHHNFDDRMVATEGDVAVTFAQTRVDYDTPTVWTATAEEGDTVLWGPLTLELVSCTNLGSNEDCSGRYQ